MIKYFTLFLLSIIFLKINSQSPIHFTTDNGLPSNHIYDIEEDNKGFMWFATNRGIVKYDGINFKIFTLKDGLPNNDIWLLMADESDRIWYVSKNKYQGYIYEDSVYKFPIENGLVLSPSIKNNNNTVWYYDYRLNNGVFSKKEKWNDFNLFISKASKKFSFNLEKATLINEMTCNQVTVLEENRVLIIDENYNKIVDLNISVDFSKNATEVTTKCGGMYFNQFYFYAFNNGILLINSKINKVKYYSYTALIEESIKSNIAFQYKNNKIQLCLRNSMIELSDDLEIINTISLPTLGIQRSYLDHNENLWLASLNNGVSLIPNMNFNSYYLKGNLVEKIGEINNSIVVGGSDGFYFLKEDSFVLMSKNTGLEIISYQIKSDTLNHKNYLISGKELIILDSKIDLTNDNISNQYFDTIQTHPNWRDVIQYKNKEYRIKYSSIESRDLDSDSLILIKQMAGLLTFQLYNNTLFIGGANGLYRIQNDTLKKVFNHHKYLNISISCMSIYKSNMIVGTAGRGIYFYNQKEIIPIQCTDGLMIQKVIVKNNHLWLATDNGVKVIKIDSNNVENSTLVNSFYKEDGILSNNINDILLKDSFLYVASDVGLAKINWENEYYNQKPLLYFSNTTDTLIFNYERSSFYSIKYAVLNYINQKRLNYEYRILPIQEDWIKTNTLELNFSNLAPNTYTIEVKATDQHNNQSIKKLFLLIKPLWWQGVKFKILIAFLLTTFLFYVFRLFRNKIKKREEKKASIEKKNIAIELHALRSQMNPHFVHNSLNAIQYYILRNEVELSEKYLSKFSKLIRSFFKYSKEQNISLKNEIELLENYLEIEKMRFEEKMRFSIIIDEKIDVEELMIPAMILQPIVENSINHGLFHKTEDGLVTIKFIFIDRFRFQVIIEDNGIGINNSTIINLNESVRSTSVLLERLELLRQSKEWDIEYQAIDISSFSDKTGTLIKLTFNQIS